MKIIDQRGKPFKSDAGAGESESRCGSGRGRCCDGPMRCFFHPDFNDPSLTVEILGPMPRSRSQPATKVPKELPAYLAHLYRIPLLTPDQEQHCFRKMNFLKHLSNIHSTGVMAEGTHPTDRDGQASEEPEPLNEQIVRIRNLIVESNLRLVVSLARRYARQTRIEFEELISIGNAALVRSADLFDFRRNVRFSTYAYQAIQRSYFDVIKGSASSRLIDHAEGEEAIALVSGDAAISLHSEHRARFAQCLVRDLLQKLDLRDQRILMSRFGIDSDQGGKSFQVISKSLGISSTRTAQLYHRSIAQLRRALEEEESMVGEALAT